MGDVSARVLAKGWDLCVVVNEENIVLGRLKRDALEGDADAIVESVMEPGPVTYRPNVVAADAARTLAERHVHSVLVTTGDGELIGVFGPEGAPSPSRVTRVIPTGNLEQMREVDRVIIEELHIELLQMMRTQAARSQSKHADWSAVTCMARVSSYSPGGVATVAVGWRRAAIEHLEGGCGRCSGRGTIPVPGGAAPPAHHPRPHVSGAP